MRKKGEELLLFLFTVFVYCFVCFYLPYKYPDLPKSLSASFEAVIPGGVSAREAAEIIRKAGAVGDAKALARAMADIGIDPVSYTHLDVYKRQATFTASCGMRMLSSVTQRFETGP